MCAIDVECSYNMNVVDSVIVAVLCIVILSEYKYIQYLTILLQSVVVE